MTSWHTALLERDSLLLPSFVVLLDNSGSLSHPAAHAASPALVADNAGAVVRVRFILLLFHIAVSAALTAKLLQDFLLLHLHRLGMS